MFVAKSKFVTFHFFSSSWFVMYCSLLSVLDFSKTKNKKKLLLLYYYCYYYYPLLFLELLLFHVELWPSFVYHPEEILLV